MKFNNYLICFTFIKCVYIFLLILFFTYRYHIVFKYLFVIIILNYRLRTKLWILKQTKDYPEKGHGTSAIQGAIRNVCLTGKIFCIFDRSYHPFHSKKCRQVGRVRGYDDQSEKPPYATHDSRARCLNKFTKI